MNAEKLLANFDSIIAAPGGVARVREAILQLAVRGRLVSQNSTDAPASALMGAIKLEKERMIKAGEIKGGKPLPCIEESRFLLDLPPGWVWSRLGDYCHVEMGQSPPSTHYNQQEDGLPFFQGKADFGPLTATARYWCTKPTKLARAGDVLLSVRAPVGPTNFAAEKCCIGRGLAALRPLAGVLSAHLLWTIRAFERNLAELGTGTTFSAISRKDIERFTVPVPPLAEQKRIVAKVDELMALCDEFEEKQKSRDATRKSLQVSALDALATAETPAALSKAWTRVCNHWATIISTPESIARLREMILQLAVRGKLVSQNSGDEPAAHRIKKARKAIDKFIAENKAKNHKYVNADLIFLPEGKTPSGWAWSALGHVGIINPRNRVADDTQVGFVPMSHISAEFGKGVRYEQTQWESIKSGYTHIADGDVIMAKITPCYENGKSALVGGLPNHIGAGTTELYVFRDVGGVFEAHFLLMVLKSPGFIKAGISHMTGTAGQKRLPANYFALSPIAIPPLAEQKRIVAKVDELMALCDKLEASINKQVATSGALARAICQSEAVIAE